MKLVLILVVVAQIAHASSMKEIQKESEKFAQEEAQNIQEQILGTKIWEEADFLSQDGPQFNYEEAKQRANTSEIETLLKTSKKRETFEGAEDFLTPSQKILDHPNEPLEVAKIHNELVTEQISHQTCEEEGVYQMAFSQKLTVKYQPEIKQQIKQCGGHEKTKEFYWKKDAEHEKHSREKKLSKDPEIDSYHLSIEKGGIFHDYVLRITWHHHSQANSCDEFRVEEKLVQTAQEEDIWKAEDPEGLSFIESSPTCKLLTTQYTQAPETRVIEGTPIFRSGWERVLYFSCEPDADSKCAQLRQQGGILVSKKCLEDTPFGECSLWRKIYDLGKNASYEKSQVSFQKEEIFGLNTESPSYDKSADFGPSITALSVFSDLKTTLEQEGNDLSDKVEIFKGTPFRCQKSFIGGELFDCCQKMEGLAVAAKLAKCKTEERCLAENRTQGKCRFVGSQKLKLGTTTEHVYCCFPSKLARVVQEQGRKQLGIKWGSIDHPRCRGLTVQELQAIDFTKLDLTEVVEEMKVDSKEYEKSLRGRIQPLQSKIQAEVQQKKLEQHLQAGEKDAA